MGRNLWELTRAIIYLQPEGETGFASVLSKRLSLLRGKTAEGFPPTEQELGQARKDSQTSPDAAGDIKDIKEYFSSDSASPMLKKISAGYGGVSFLQAFLKKTYLEVI